MTIRIALADDHPIVLDRLEQLFRVDPDFLVVARCRDGQQTLQAVREHVPDVLVLDIRMPGLDGLGVLRALVERRSRTRTVLLTAALNDEELIEAVRLDARGVVLKDMAPQLLLEAVRAVHSGKDWLEAGLGGRVLRRLLDGEERTGAVRRLLTPRELEIVRLVADGLRNRSIGDRLCISEGTVKIHLHNIYEKLGLGGRVELALYARNHGLA